ncbi:hypothetical protein A3C23_04035 [Candidatus Roizmanbacteria bacterium RIFCSPHIGHO2_02_FULL_37_13b]|uniref:ABC transporter n=1 Tax=Candidatus Roizmanbacteria bacterium RIFCSPLOWO2_02_FULL_36_11 TaxID=1802071 RepID=A0A1F7JGY8_9BACT|nr:MAG: hypothetical protein A3C23_04035 [Candidatus Roizmanbacteria bacterium RIFCSPHIGHO2_02_FULL_37_13b]OGK54887.1 MAG: hypothetical protein A3H78_00185 [Candidatus Roizmanbacteria bacterium RIFCSPLOWO2_02_FULL_36_11]
MSKIWVLARKEINFYLNNPLGYIVAAIFAVFSNFLFMKDIFLRGNTSLRPFFDFIPWVLMIFIPALAMRIFSEEKRTQTIELLLSLPIEEKRIVMGKYFGTFVYSLIALALTLSIPITVNYLGRVSLAEVIVSYFGVICLIGLFLAISIWFSSMTKNQIVAFLASILVLFLTIAASGDFFAPILPRALLEIINIFTPLYHYNTFLKGIIDLRSLIYFFSVSLFFIYITVVNLKDRQ